MINSHRIGESKGHFAEFGRKLRIDPKPRKQFPLQTLVIFWRLILGGQDSMIAQYGSTTSCI